MNRLINCYNQINKILKDDIEPIESVQLVETYRRYWKPESLRIILVGDKLSAKYSEKDGMMMAWEVITKKEMKMEMMDKMEKKQKEKEKE